MQTHVRRAVAARLRPRLLLVAAAGAAATGAAANGAAATGAAATGADGGGDG